MGLKKTFKKAKKTVKKVVKTAAPIAAMIPGPWQVPALAYNSANAAIHGNLVGAGLSALGAYGAGGGFSASGFDSNTLTNPGGLSNWYSNAYGPEAGWAGGTPVASGYNSPITDLGYDTSIFGDAPSNLNTISNSGVNPVSPMSGGDLGSFVNQNITNAASPFTDSPLNNWNQPIPSGTEAYTPTSGNWSDAYSNPDINTSSIMNGSGTTYSPPDLSSIYTTPQATNTITGSTPTLSSGIAANGTSTLTGGSSGVTGAVNTAPGVTGLINGVAGVASGVGNLVAAGNTADLQKTIEQRSDPFGSQRAFYQGQLKDSYTNPFGSAENQGLLNMYQQAAARKAAANGQRSNPLHQNIAFSNAMLPQLSEQRKTLGNLAGAGIDPNGGNAAMTALNSTGASQTANGYASAAQGLQSLYNYFNRVNKNG